MQKLILSILIALPLAAWGQTPNTNDNAQTFKADVTYSTNQWDAWTWWYKSYTNSLGTNAGTAGAKLVEVKKRAAESFTRHLGREANELVEKMQSEADARAKQRQLMDRVRTWTDAQIQWALTNPPPNL